MDSIDDAASMDYLAVQSIGVFDNRPENMEIYKDQVRRLQNMGIKVILATGLGPEEALAIALNTGIIKNQHKNICGAIIEGSDLRKIYSGRDSNLNYDITPEYLSVVCRATAEDRCMLVDYLAKIHPGRMNVWSENTFDSEFKIKSAPEIACVGAIGTGDNDTKMLNKAKISFSTYNRSHEEARKAADMVLMTDSLEDVITAVSKARQYKDHLLKFVLLQIPASITAIAMVLS